MFELGGVVGPVLGLLVWIWGAWDQGVRVTGLGCERTGGRCVGRIPPGPWVRVVRRWGVL